MVMRMPPWQSPAVRSDKCGDPSALMTIDPLINGLVACEEFKMPGFKPTRDDLRRPALLEFSTHQCPDFWIFKPGMGPRESIAGFATFLRPVRKIVTLIDLGSVAVKLSR